MSNMSNIYTLQLAKMAQSVHSQNLPSMSGQPSQNLPSTSRLSPRLIPSLSRQRLQDLSSMSRQPFQNLPSTSRRPSQNLPSTSGQPSQEMIRLETHTWHAERFHMIDKWGYKIPHYSNDTSLKVSYKAITRDCLLQDISYYTCIEIVGEKKLLKATLKKHCNPTKTFAAKMYTSGQKEGTIMFFKKNGYPQFPIGYVNFFWKLSQTNIKTIWIWVHPAFYNDFLREIIYSFNFKRNNAKQDRADISHNLTDFYINDAGCEMRVLKYALNRFRLSGPAALTVLKDALRVPSLTELGLDSENCPMAEEQDSSSSDEKLDTPTDISVQFAEKMVIDETDAEDFTIHDLKENMWHTKYYKKRENIEAFKIQQLMWQLMKVLGSPRFLLSNMIMGLTVLDPRSNLEERRTKTEIPSSAESLCCQLPTDLSRSPIWDAQIRQIVSNSYASTNTTDEFMDAAGMSDDPHFNEDARIPILLIQKPAVASLDLGSRIDIIIPSRWAMAFWKALTTQSALVGGLRETNLIVFQSLGTRVPDFNDPDTPAYTREALIKKKECTKKYFSSSPMQRFNFITSGIRSPFFCDWRNLIRGWSNVENFYVLRDSRLLALLKEEIETIELRNAGILSTVQGSVFDIHQFDEYKNCLVQVQLSMVKKRTPREFAIICMPTPNDLMRFEKNENCGKPVEKCHSDPHEKSREMLYRLHKIQLREIKQVSRKLKRKKMQDNALPGEVHPTQGDINRAKLLESRQTISDDFAERIRKWYIPESTEVRHSCGRNVMGYVVMGSYSSRLATDIGIGYVALNSLTEIILKNSNIVLVRNNKGLQYRFARLEIL